MVRKFRFPGVLAALLLVVSISCEKTIDDDPDTGDIDNSLDYVWDTSNVVIITLNGTSITASPEVVSISGSKVTIVDPGTYKITGSLSDGQIIVNSEDEGNVRLLLDGADIKCSNSSPLYIKKSDKTLIQLVENTTNVLSDGSAYTSQVEGEPSACLFSNSDLVIYGDGHLNITGNYSDGISSDDALMISSGKITVTAKDDGIRGKDFILVKGGNINVSSKGDGLKSDNSAESGKGYVYIEYAQLTVSSTTDAISACTSLTIEDGIFNLTSGGGSSGTFTTSAKALKGLTEVVVSKGTFTISSADDAVHSNGKVKIDGGTLAISTKDDGIHADASIEINDGTITISKSYESLESYSITINGGKLNMVSSDDGINATKGSPSEYDDGSKIYINGGSILISSSNGDGLDSNGSAVMTGGTLVIHGPQSQPEVGFDINGTFNVNGGFLFATGPNAGGMIETPSSGSALYSFKASSSSLVTSSSLFHVQDASGKDIVTYKPVRNVYYFVVAAPEIASGSSYSIYTGGTTTGTLTNGIYTGGSYSGGTLKKTFTISGKVTNVTF